MVSSRCRSIDFDLVFILVLSNTIMVFFVVVLFLYYFFCCFKNEIKNGMHARTKEVRILVKGNLACLADYVEKNLEYFAVVLC